MTGWLVKPLKELLNNKIEDFKHLASGHRGSVSHRWHTASYEAGAGMLNPGAIA